MVGTVPTIYGIPPRNPDNCVFPTKLFAIRPTLYVVALSNPRIVIGEDTPFAREYVIPEFNV
jgi:hypothetical protein